MELVFVSHNIGKVNEAKNILGKAFIIKSLTDVGYTQEIPETHPTLEENAFQKCSKVFDDLHVNCFADDSGLEVDALNGQPGVFSARYAGEACIAEDNMDRLLTELNGIADRKARFHTVISLILSGTEFRFHGTLEGSISLQMKGDNGFGYDPVFIPAGYDKTMAQIPSEIKNTISHRYIALQQMADFLNSL
jgi:XTP/dITP diphosphohydrolase